jgi:pimeloyl-ACP methyl ester carboxylesterase
LLNYRGQRLRCSHFQPANRPAEKLPCVIYLHGNSSSRLEALSCLPLLLRYNITLFCLDCAGSGLSDGEYVSLGYFERDDLAVVVDHLRQSGTVGCIGLWGRSMGAATALLHSDRDPSIAGMVLDSPFTSLRSLAEELVEMFIGVNLPKWMVSIAMNLIRSTIKSKAHFDINDLSPISHVDKAYIPALFVSAESDSFIRPDHAKKLYTAYAGDKNLIIVDGDHNSVRPKFFLDSVAIFFYNTLQCDSLPKKGKNVVNDASIFFPDVSPDRVSSQEEVNRTGIQMRPPDRSAPQWNQECQEEVLMQHAIEESLKHVASEETPDIEIRRQKSNSSP